MTSLQRPSTARRGLASLESHLCDRSQLPCSRLAARSACCGLEREFLLKWAKNGDETLNISMSGAIEKEPRKRAMNCRSWLARRAAWWSVWLPRLRLPAAAATPRLQSSCFAVLSCLHALVLEACCADLPNTECTQRWGASPAPRESPPATVRTVTTPAPDGEPGPSVQQT